MLVRNKKMKRGIKMGGKKKLVFALTLILTLGILNTTVFAGNYTGYVLKRFKGNNYTGIHTKKTSRDYITNRVTAITNAPRGVNFWAVNVNKNAISKKYNQKVGNTTQIKFTKSGYNRAGVQVGMGMENARSSKDYGWVSGVLTIH